MPLDIKERRKELGITLEQIGRFVGVSKGTVKKWESGAIKNMRRDKIAKLAEILRVSPTDFLDNCTEPRLLTQKKVPLNEELKKTYNDFILSVFGIQQDTDNLLIAVKDNSIILINPQNTEIKDLIDIV